MDKELLEIVGNELSANSYINLYEYVLKEKRGLLKELKFSDYLRIEIQEKSKLVGTKISGSEFGLWLNSYVLNKLINIVS